MEELVIVTSAAGVTGVATGVLAIIAAVDPSITNIMGVVIGGVVTITMGIITYKTVALNKQIAAQTEKIEQTLRTTEVIKGHVNSEKTKAEGEIAGLQKEVKWLRESIADKKEEAALLAQSVATHPPSTGVTRQAPVTLKAIEKNTKETAENTAATDVTVNEIKEQQ